MQIAGEAFLISATPNAHGIFGPHTESMRKVFCQELSVGRTEMYAAMTQGLQPELVLRLTHDFEYQGECAVQYNGIRYDIIRTYRTTMDGIELTLQRSNADYV